MRITICARLALSSLFLLLCAAGGLAQSPILSGRITTYAGPSLPADGDKAASQLIENPGAVAPDGAGGFYVVSSTQNRVYRVASDGTLRVVAGTGAKGFNGDGRPASSAQLSSPRGIAVDGAGNVFITDHDNQRIRKVRPDG